MRLTLWGAKYFQYKPLIILKREEKIKKKYLRSQQNFLSVPRNIFGRFSFLCTL